MTRDSSETLRFLPIGLDLRGKDCLVVGGGGVGTRKAATLTQAGALVTVVSPAITDELAGEIDAGHVRWLQEAFRDEHVDGATLAVAATDDEALNIRVVQAAAQRGVLVCDASSAERSQVIFGALLDDGEVTIAVFTGGRDPGLARKTRDRIAETIDREGGTEPEN